jgi:predicted DNA-binding protein YlxM (UPF0122 family)
LTICQFSCSPEIPEEVTIEIKKLTFDPDYNFHVKPILSDKCFACHGPDKGKQKAGLRLDLAENAFAELPESPRKVAIKPGNLRKSEFFYRIISDDPDFQMPEASSHLSLSNREKAILIKWIENGAAYKPHWALVPPQFPDLPKSKWGKQVKNEIDLFIHKGLQEEKMVPSAPAEKELLLRRLSFDLTGLPPSLSELDDFIRDPAPNAYEKQVDRLLASPHFGEKMAVHWLDIARYADSHGYTVDRIREMSPYRDWVISAFNRNMPFNQFAQWQLAGDLYRNPSKEMIIATAFNRNHPQNMEGGIIEEEFQMEYVADRTNTFGEAFLGLSIGCARCHNHKYDPISQENYYQLFSFFNNVQEAGQISWNSATPTPTLLLPTKEQEKVIAYIKKNIYGEEQKIRMAKKNKGDDFDKWLVSGAYKKLENEVIPQHGLTARFTFDKNDLQQQLNKKEKGVMKRESGMEGGKPIFSEGKRGRALLLDGDEYLDLGQIGVFRKSDPFSIGMDVRIPSDFKEGVIFHKSEAERLYNFRGFHLYVKDGHFEINMAHTAPSNAITKISKEKIPREKWIHLALVYDGSSTAAGFDLYLDGRKLNMVTTMDQLTKEILFGRQVEPGIQIGAWWRGLGFKGGKVDHITVYRRNLSPFEVAVLAGKAEWKDITSKKPALLNQNERLILEKYYEDVLDKSLKILVDSLSFSRKSLADSLEKVEELMVMQESKIPKKTYLLHRGHYENKGKEVFPATPEAVLPFPEYLPKNRLGLAKWLFLPGHPLTSRVIVNRFWQYFFGNGLVKTAEDFGNQGSLPSHPELLDWLAITFQQSAWDVKALIKSMVMSATYQQSSVPSESLRSRDPENRYYARGPSERLTAEMLRDNALFAGGLLNRQIGGKSIKPYQPDKLWEINSAGYQVDTGNLVYRRSLYILIKRSVPNPTLSTFDAGSRSFCMVSRQKTNTPLQVLVTLNDPTYVEVSKVMGEKMQAQGNENKAISDSFRRLTARKPTKLELELLLQLKKSQEKMFREQPEKAKGWLSAGQYVLKPIRDTAGLAAHAVVVNTILNTDATLTKR